MPSHSSESIKDDWEAYEMVRNQFGFAKTRQNFLVRYNSSNLLDPTWKIFRNYTLANTINSIMLKRKPLARKRKSHVIRIGMTANQNVSCSVQTYQP